MNEFAIKGTAAAVICCALSMGWPSLASAADCASLTAAFDEALTRRDLPAAEGAEQKIAHDAACSAKTVEVQRRRAGLQVTMAEALKNDPARQGEREKLLTAADKPNVNWTAAYAIGELHFSQRRFALAAEDFERAIEIVKNESFTPKSPGKSATETLLSRASQAKLLAANEEGGKPAAYVTAAKDHRDGTVGGSLSDNIRGVRPTSVPLPINFVTAEATFTPIGEKAAAELAQAIVEQKPQEIVLTGHTDERGEDEYNMRLSRARVEAVVRYLDQYLKAHNMSLQIRAEWYGKRRPLQIDDASGLTREDIWALNRRVEWKRQ